MKKLIPQLILITFFTLFGVDAIAQCPNDPTAISAMPTESACDVYSAEANIRAGEGRTWPVYAGSTYEVTTCLGTTTFDTELTLYNDASGAFIAENDDACGVQSIVNWTSNFSGDVRVVLDQFPCTNGGISSSATLSIRETAAPVNDLCAGAIGVAVGGSANGDTRGRCTSPEVAPFCGTGDGTGGGLWYTVAGNGSELNASLCGSTFDTKIRVYTGSCASLSCVTGTDDSGPCPVQSEVEFCTTLGTTYYILVHGFSASEGEFTLAITDVGTPPTAVCQNVTVQLNAAGNASVTAAQIDNGSSDECGIASLSVSPNSFNCTNVGANTVTLTVTDFAGVSSTCTSTVTVQDNTGPTALCQDQTVVLDASGNASVTAAQINNGSSDVCGIASLSVTPSSFTCANVGANTVTLTVTDVNGNSSTCTSTVTVQDNTAPTAVCQNRTVVLNASGNGSVTAAQINNGSSDNCSIASISVSPSSFTCANVGANTVTLTVTDVNGNLSTCQSVVTVQDNTLPTALCQSATVVLDASGNGSVTAAQINNGSSDNCGIASISVMPSSFTCANVGANTVTLTVMDVNGNSSTCTSTVTVQDNTGPTALCQDQTVVLDASGNASVTAAQIDNGSSDECGIASLSVTPSSFTCANVGANTVTLTVTDVNGNSSTCTSTVTVQDNTGPTALCQDQTVVLDASGNASVTATQINNGSTDNCALGAISVTPSSFTCANLGANTVTFTAIDINGNSSTCTAIVTVNQDVSSTSPTGGTATPNYICTGDAVTLVSSSATLGAGATYEWYSGSCGGTPVASGASISVNPSVTTDYYVRVESVCGDVLTSCDGPITVTVNGSSTTPSSATLTGSTVSATCTVNDANWHYFYDLSGNLLAGVKNTVAQNLGDVTITIEVGNAGPFGSGLPPGICGSPGVSNGEYALARNWDIQITGTNPVANPVDIVFYYNDSELSDLSSTIAGLAYSADYIQCWGDVSSTTDLTMTVNHTGGSTQIITPTFATGPSAGITQTEFQLSEFSQGFLHSNGGITGANNALPVELLSFDAQVVENSFVSTTWSTATEVNNSGFELLRSTDGINFEAIAWIEGNGNSSDIQNYSYNDFAVANGVYYYQLKQVDFNGDYEYFDIKIVKLEGTESISVGEIIPNPAENQLGLALSIMKDELITLDVFNYVGQKVLTQEINATTGKNNIDLDVSSLPDGAYYVILDVDNEIVVRKFLVAR